MSSCGRGWGLRPIEISSLRLFLGKGVYAFALKQQGTYPPPLVPAPASKSERNDALGLGQGQNTHLAAFAPPEVSCRSSRRLLVCMPEPALEFADDSTALLGNARATSSQSVLRLRAHREVRRDCSRLLVAPILQLAQFPPRSATCSDLPQSA